MTIHSSLPNWTVQRANIWCCNFTIYETSPNTIVSIQLYSRLYWRLQAKRFTFYIWHITKKLQIHVTTEYKRAKV